MIYEFTYYVDGNYVRQVFADFISANEFFELLLSSNITYIRVVTRKKLI